MTDLFPAVVGVYPPEMVGNWESPYPTVGCFDVGGTQFNECRVIVHKNYVLVGADTPRGPSPVFKAEVAAIFKEGSYTKVLTTSGFLVVFTASRGCGCGSRLRSWNPYGNVVASARG